MNNYTKKLTITALMMAIICLSTMFLGFPILYGYVNLGDAGIFLAGFILGPKYGFIAAAFGAAFADYSLSFTQYMLTTFIVKGLMAFLAGRARDKSNTIKITSCGVGGLIMVAGYYITEIFVYGSKISPLANIPWNTLQFIIGMVIAFALIKPLKDLIQD